MPPDITAKETLNACARAPAIKLPKGINPAKVSINTLITLPRNISGTLVCNIVLISAMEETLEPPKNSKINRDNKKALDIENNISEIENIKEDTIRNLPLY
jgi:hypothetical protein